MHNLKVLDQNLNNKLTPKIVWYMKFIFYKEFLRNNAQFEILASLNAQFEILAFIKIYVQIYLLSTSF